MPSQRSYYFWKRVFDVLLSLALSALLLPVVIVFSLLTALETRAFPLYIQDRGLFLEGKRFRIFKFRTMRKRSGFQPDLRPSGVFSKPEFAEYVPFFCGWLRRTGLDEIPQLWNIFIGEMSFVGPRPLAIEDLEVMKRESPALYAMRASLSSPAGLTGLWQLFGSREKGVENLVELDLEYERNRSFLLDLMLLLGTIPTALLGLRADAIMMKPTVRTGRSEKGAEGPDVKGEKARIKGRNERGRIQMLGFSPED
ncbi:MAG TPA: sugar transferase [Bacteroidota bacterium]|nr:sugar transferase [Bacteroidota bacterium]